MGAVSDTGHSSRHCVDIVSGSNRIQTRSWTIAMKRNTLRVNWQPTKKAVGGARRIKKTALNACDFKLRRSPRLATIRANLQKQAQKSTDAKGDTGTDVKKGVGAGFAPTLGSKRGRGLTTGQLGVVDPHSGLEFSGQLLVKNGKTYDVKLNQASKNSLISEKFCVLQVGGLVFCCSLCSISRCHWRTSQNCAVKRTVLQEIEPVMCHLMMLQTF